MSFSTEGIKWLEDKVGSPYLHYRKSNHIGGKKTPTYNDIQNIILTQRGKLLSNIAKFSSAGADIKDVERILREFSTDGQIGQKIYQELNSRSLSREAAISNGESSIFKTSSDFFSAATPQITSDMTRTIDYINDNLNRMIVEIAKGTPSFALAIVQNYYGKGADNIPSIVKAYIPSNCTISQKDLQDAANVNKHLSNIKAAMNLENVTVDAVIKAVEKNINQISGSFYEQAVNYSFNTIGQKALKQTAKEVNQAFKSAKFASTWTGDILALNEDGKTSSGKKVKGDITVEYNEGGIVYRFGGSIKLRNGDGYLGGKKNWLTNLSPRSRTLLTGINDLVSAGALSAQYGEALLGFRSADVSNATWESLKRGIAAVAIAEALSGLGNQVEDTSGLLIINSKIYSISDILTKLAKMAATPGQRMSAISVRGMQKPTPENEGLVEKNPFVGAYRRNWAVYHRELNKTISFWLNMNWFLK